MGFPPVPKEHVNTVCVDLDGTLAEDVWPSAEIGEPIEKGIEMLKHYRSLGYAIVIYTARPKSHEQSIWGWLYEHELENYVYDVQTGKPLACLYIDDRGWRFER